jgi:alkylhydroperoxidase family enzyme
MAWIHTIGPDDRPTGLLGRIYGEALRRAGRVWNIVRLMSLRPRQLEASLGLYQAVMFGESGLSRAERELIATVVSRVNECFY